MYLFAHETLRITAEEQLGAELARYREGICDWIGSYAALGWPDTTPGYAIRGYPRLLTATSDATRLSALARDPRRHAFLLRATGSDYAALAEIRTAQGLIADQKVPDLQALVELAVYRHAISIRNQSIPAALPAVWARLGRFDHAEALARTITSPDARARALAELASAAAQAGDPDRASRLAADAEALARAITSPDDQAQALTELARAAAQAGDPDRAEALARTITTPTSRRGCSPSWPARPPRPATRTAPRRRRARTITDPDDQARRSPSWPARPPRPGTRCCASLKIPMKAALMMPMWGCRRPRSRGGCGALMVVVPVVVGELPGYVSVTSVTAARAACSSTMALPAV